MRRGDRPNFGHSRARYHPRMSWPYEKCAGVRVDGEHCSSRAGFGSLYCHHHDPARKTSSAAPTSAAASATRAPSRLAAATIGNARAKPAALPNEPRMTCERCDQPTFPGRGFCAEHLLESLGLEYDETPEERELNRRCVARRRDGARCRDRYENRETKLRTDHQRLLDGGVDFEDVLRGVLPAGPDPKPSPPKRARAKKPSGKNGTPPVLADVAVTEEEHEQVAATVGDILREARSSSREAIEETVALLLDAQRAVNVVVPPGRQARPEDQGAGARPEAPPRRPQVPFRARRGEGGRSEVDDVLRELPAADDLGGVRAPAVQVEVRLHRLARTARHRAPDRGRAPGRLGGAPQERRQRREPALDRRRTRQVGAASGADLARSGRALGLRGSRTEIFRSSQRAAASISRSTSTFLNRRGSRPALAPESLSRRELGLRAAFDGNADTLAQAREMLHAVLGAPTDRGRPRHDDQEGIEGAAGAQ